MAISITDVTSNVTVNSEGEVTGDGVFDILQASINKHLDTQFNSGRITGTEYARVYVEALKANIQAAISFVLNRDKANEEADLLKQKGITEFAQTLVNTKTTPVTNSMLDKQAKLLEMQAKGFKWNADQKYLDTIMKAWSMNTTTAGTPATEVNAINATGTNNINDIIAAAAPTE